LGAWSWLDRRIEAVRLDAGCQSVSMLYAGRPESASPAGSFHGDHDGDQTRLIEYAFTIVV
jgi:2-oxoglutarate dehydrogenase E1 component